MGVSSRVSSLLHFPRYFLPLPSDIAVAKWIHQHYHVILNVAQPWEGEAVHFSSYCQTSPIFVNILHLVCGVHSAHRIRGNLLRCINLLRIILSVASTQMKEEKSTSNRCWAGKSITEQVVYMQENVLMLIGYFLPKFRCYINNNFNSYKIHFPSVESTLSRRFYKRKFNLREENGKDDFTNICVKSI